MANKYYAVAVGKTPGIYFTWEDCKAQVDQFPGAVYKSFKTIVEAEDYYVSVTGKKVADDTEEGHQVSFDDILVQREKEETDKGIDKKQNDDSAVSTDTCLIAYVDGSYEHTKLKYSYGCVMVLEDEIVELSGSGDDEDYVSMRNVAGEILGSENAIIWAIEHGYSEVVIYYDYEGIEKWANGLWKANKPGTIRYKEFVAKKREEIKISFKKVVAHTGVTYNEMADKLAKGALE